jgi:hypothetical protein
MAIEQDKTNSAVVGTMLAIGTAAMIGGSAALVALARGEIHDQSQQFEGYANLSSVKELEAEQQLRLTSAKLPIHEARARVLAELKQDPTKASPPAPATAADPTLAPSGSATDTGAVPSAPATAGASATAVPTAAPTAPTTGSAPAPSAPNP